MENYRLLQRLGKGAQGAVFLVENRDDKVKYVLKKVECNDEADANKAFKEAMALQQLQHPYVCGYKEFFVLWDKEESAMYVCIVMEYYKMGDLDRVLKQRRSKSEYIEEVILKKWLGQIVEALVFVHKKQTIHRDLKPSNIFMTEDLNVTIGDFGVATVLGDDRTKARTTVGSMNWMAPEVLERPYDERSDVWSLGCITLEMATCGFMDAAQSSATLFQVKQSPQILEETLEKVGQKYTADLCQVIRTMLRRKFQQRPTAIDLLELPYIQECLALSNSALCKQSAEAAGAAGPGKPIPKDKGIKGILDFMSDESTPGESQVQALKYLVEITKEQDQSLDADGKKVVVDAMSRHIAVEDVQVLGCTMFSNLLVTAVDDDFLYSMEVIHAVNLAMRAHAGSVPLQTAASGLIMGLSNDEKAAAEIGQDGGVQDILAALRAFPNNGGIVTNCCGALWSLAVNEANAKIVTEEKGLQDIFSAMENHSQNSELIENACAALWSLAMEEENLEVFTDIGAVGLIIKAMSNHLKEAKVVKNACMTLASLAEAEEVFALQTLDSDEGGHGLDVVIKAYREHADNPEVVENICTLIVEMAESEEARGEMVAAKVGDILSEAKLKFAGIEEISSLANTGLQVLSGSAKSGARPVSARSRPRSARKA
ncbi:serine/threonine kinase-like domain-containing protein STKLD1 [Corticium candelabrum]|uniref:serine/threonine kinase-like domain-containing protein STKLD1 n=1 Tax=Corticium candelabrum TaxID=121492 RepID=UPI002E258510|nr:serine/threonine kinase-like domain-containing protein STKLD1 [Corticium candelabrum]